MYREGLFHELAESEKIFCMDCRLESAQKFNQGAKKRGHAEQGEKSHKLFWNFSLQADGQDRVCGIFSASERDRDVKTAVQHAGDFSFQAFCLDPSDSYFPVHENSS